MIAREGWLACPQAGPTHEPERRQEEERNRTGRHHLPGRERGDQALMSRARGIGMETLVKARRREEHRQAKQQAEEQAREKIQSLAASNQTDGFPQHGDNLPASGAGSKPDFEAYFNGLLE
jgi:hypothetical protein